MDLRIIDFPEYPWKTLDVYKDFSYTFNISPGKKIEGDLFDSSKMKVVSYNENSHVQILAVCDPYGPPFYVRRDIDRIHYRLFNASFPKHTHCIRLCYLPLNKRKQRFRIWILLL